MDFLAVSCHVYSMKSIVFTVLALLGALLPPPAAVGQQSVTDFEHGNCSTTTYNSSDSFAQNLDVVAKSLIQNSSRFMYSLASSETVSQSNSYAYGMHQCRGDISLSDCHDCVRNGFTRFLSVSSAPGYNACNNFSKGARAQYKGCYLRYENYKFYNRSGDLDADDLYEVQPICSGSSNESSALYQQNLGTALEKSATAAPKHELYGYIATSVGSGSNTAYALTQCLGYLNSLQCATCLSQVSNYSSACNKSVSGEVYFNTCYYLFSDTFFLFTYNNSPPSINSPDAPSSDPPTIAISGSMPAEGHKNHTPAIVGIVVGLCLLLAIIAALALCFLKRRKKAGRSAAEIYRAAQDVSLHADEQPLTHECGARRFSLKELRDATNDFHPDNKLGEGGFGPVYQGRLISGMEVAIKLLSAQSHQGKAEFLNEVKLITGVQHRNLIELIGYCIEDSKPILVYEYLPNRSLNLHLFDVDERNCLDWPT